MGWPSIFLLYMVLTSSVIAYIQYKDPDEIEPEFYSPLENITSTRGRDVYFTCIVNDLRNYRVAWIKLDTKAILAIHNRLVAHNQRLSVTHNGHNTWKLHIHNIEKNDSGSYMCQINTNPMRSQVGYLTVLVPPDILNDEDSPLDGHQALEGGNINIKCKASGDPEPEVSWIRKDRKPIIIRSEDGRIVESRAEISSENLTLIRVDRTDMGTYFCLARSSVPPTRSKLFNVRVNFKPSVEVNNQLIAAPLKSDVILQCSVEASPRATYQWVNNRGELIMSNSRMNVTEAHKEGYKTNMTLEIKGLEKSDYGEYNCISENTIGKAEGKIRLQELSLPEKATELSIAAKETNNEQQRQLQAMPETGSKSPKERNKLSGTETISANGRFTNLRTTNTYEKNHSFPSVLPTIVYQYNNGKSTEQSIVTGIYLVVQIFILLLQFN